MCTPLDVYCCLTLNTGLVVAARLTESGKYTVGVIEAGEYLPDEPLINTPFFVGAGVGNPKLDWNLATVPQPLANGRSIGIPRGKVRWHFPIPSPLS